MVYESGFTTRRTYSSRPVVTSYSVSYPIVTRVSQVYKTSFPIYSTSSYTRGTRVISSPVRIVSSPAREFARVIRSPVPLRISRKTTTRVLKSPERISSYNYTKPTTYTTYTPSIYYSSYTPYISSYIPSTHIYTSPSNLYSSPEVSIYSRSLTPTRSTTRPVCLAPSFLKRTMPGYGARALTNYLNTEPFTTFREEAGRIRNRAQSLIRDLHTPVVRRARSMTPFPVTGYEPTSDVAFDSYVSRITNPVRHIAKEVHRMSMYPQPAHKYVDPELDPHRPSRKFSAPRPLEDAVEDEVKEKQRLRQERLMTVNEEDIDFVVLEKKKAQRAEESKRREQKALEKEVNHKGEKAAEQKAKEVADKKAQEAVRLAEMERKKQEEEAEIRRLIELEKQAEEAIKVAKEAEKIAIEKEQNRKAAEENKKRLEEEIKLAEEAKLIEEKRLIEEARQAEESRQAEEAKRAEEARQAEEIRQAEAAKQAEEAGQAEEIRQAEEARQYEEARQAEETRQTEEDRQAEEARKAEETKQAEEARQAEGAERREEEARIIKEAKLAEESRKADEASRLIEEQRIREEEIKRLGEIERQAKEEREGELARQAAELSEIARLEADIAAQKLENIQQSETIVSTAEEPIIDQPVTSKIEQQQENESSVDLNISNCDAEVVEITTDDE